MLVEPERSRHDLSFRLFGFPVRINPMFWLGAALLGGNLLGLGLDVFLLWILAVLASILVHELGHALAFRFYRIDSGIALYAFGGLTVPSMHLSGRGRRALVSMAGPAAGFLLCAALYYSDRLTSWAGTSRYALLAYAFLFSINLYWGLFNLLPVWPLDGGQITREACTSVSRRNGLRASLEISVAVGGLVALYSLACEMGGAERLHEFLPAWFPSGSYWTAILFGVLAVQSFQLLQQGDWVAGHWEGDDDRPPWRR